METLSEVLWPVFHGCHACVIRGPDGSKSVPGASGAESAALDAMDRDEARAKSHSVFSPCRGNQKLRQRHGDGEEQDLGGRYKMVPRLSTIIDTFPSRGRKESTHGSNSTETTRPGGSCL